MPVQNWMQEGVIHYARINRLWLHKSSQLALLLKEAVRPTCSHPHRFPALVHCETTHMPIPPEEKGQLGWE